MSKTPQAPSLHRLSAAAGEPVMHALTTAIPAAAEGRRAPDWITLFPRVGKVSTRDGREFDVEPASLVATFLADALQLPVDINHATNHVAFSGGRADAIGWIVELKAEGEALLGRVEWLEEGEALIASRKYRYISPTFYTDQRGKVTRLMAAGLVTAPALAQQPALAGAKSPQEPSMKTISLAAVITALGLAADSDEPATLAALTSRVSATVSKDVHDATLAQLSSVSTELAELKGNTRKTEVDALISAALAAKTILPAEKDHYVALCASDDGLSSVRALLAARAPLLPGSGLGERNLPESGQQALSAVDRQVMLSMGITEEQFRAAQA